MGMAPLHGAEKDGCGRTNERYTLSIFLRRVVLFEGMELWILPGGVNRLYIGIEIHEYLRKYEVL
jgi:hypothetical protein